MSVSASRQQSLQGCLSAFCDGVLRKERIWSAEQLFEILSHWVAASPREILPEDLADRDIRAFCWRYLSNRLERAGRNAVPLVVQDVQSYTGKVKVCDVRFGWDLSNGPARRMPAAKLPPVEAAFTVAHVNEYVPLTGPFQSLLELLSAQSTSYLEKLFYTEWKRRYYAPSAPALIPEVHRFSTAMDRCGARHFTYLDDKSVPHRGRIDFFVYNAQAGVAAFIELDGQEAHKTPAQRQVDAMKRNVCADAGIPLLVFTYDDVQNRLDKVMNGLDHLFRSTPDRS